MTPDAPRLQCLLLLIPITIVSRWLIAHANATYKCILFSLKSFLFGKFGILCPVEYIVSWRSVKVHLYEAGLPTSGLRLSGVLVKNSNTYMWIQGYVCTLFLLGKVQCSLPLSVRYHSIQVTAVIIVDA